METAFKFLSANYRSVAQRINPGKNGFLVNVTNPNNSPSSAHLSLATYIALISIATNRLAQNQMVIMGDLSIGGSIQRLENLAADSGTKKLLILTASMVDMTTMHMT